MYSMLRKILTGALIALLMVVMVFQAAIAEDLTNAEEASQTEVQAAETSAEPAIQPSPEPSAEAEPQATASVDEQPAQEQPAIQPEAEATIEPEPEAAAEVELVEIPDEQVPLAGGQEPIVTVRANRDINGLQVGDSLVLTSELAGFTGTEYTIRWQARVDGQWKDLEGEHSTKLIIKITGDNADWSYRAAVDAQPVA